jgi:hypothetical protein
VRTKRKACAIDAIGPTPEQMARETYIIDRPIEDRRIVVRYARVRQLEKLSKEGLFTVSQSKALYNYRHNADMADRSPITDSLGQFMPKAGKGDGPGISVLNAIDVVRDVESAAGPLASVLRLVIVDDNSLSSWAMVNYGKKQDCKTIGEKKVCYDRPTEKAMRLARRDVQIVASRVEAEMAS